MADSDSVLRRMTFKFQPLMDTVDHLVRTRGWPYLAAWVHRVTGAMLLLYVFLHIYTLSSLTDPAQFDAKMKILGFAFFVLLEFLLALPVIYHALNGGRLILYEVFENRRDQLVLKWVIGLGSLYTTMLAVFMLAGNQTVSAPFFWIYTAAAGGCLVYITVNRLRRSGASLFWKLQRIGGAFLFLMVPAHMLFMHLNPAMGHEAQIIIERMGNLFIKLIDMLLVTAVLYHGSYGLYAIGQDYLKSAGAKTGLLVIVTVTALGFAWAGLKLIVQV